GLQHNEFAQAKIDATIAELREERDTVKDLLA
ncbi:MAG: malate dehydrogenase, partial [Fuerstiella sp.]|nr:malate dehydrogenase [Fuerstiella sp.]